MSTAPTLTIDPSTFASQEALRRLCAQVGEAGLRGTASEAHERTIEWIEAELNRISGVTTRSEWFDIERWQPSPSGDLERAGRLRLAAGGSEPRDVPVAGAVPYSLPTAPEGVSGDLVYLAADQPITAAVAAGRVVLRDFPHTPVPLAMFRAAAYSVTPDLDAAPEYQYDRGALADELLHRDLLAAGRAGAAGVVIAFDFPREQIAGYFEPHKGTHYAVPAVFVGGDERELLRRHAGDGTAVTVAVAADAAPARTRNLIATLPGRSAERAVLAVHTDGNTWVQDNGVAALLALADYFARLPMEMRVRTLEFAFTTAHLHISREGTVRYAQQLDDEYDDGSVAFVFPMEHMGTRELVPVARDDGPGRRLEFSGRPEPLLWAAGPSDAMSGAVQEAVTRRRLDGVVVTRGIGAPDAGRVPEYASFGGLGGSYHTRLLPTTSIISGPWSLWAPSFGADAIDFARFRDQVMAAGDVVLALEQVSRADIAGGYLAHRADRARGVATAVEEVPPERASG